MGFRRVFSFLAVALTAVLLVAGCVKQEEQDYTTEPTDPMEEGAKPRVVSNGEVVYVPNAEDESLWDEIHIFRFNADAEGADITDGQANFSFIVSEDIEGAEILIVAGGGGGGGSRETHGAGGGGAGGVIHGTDWTIPQGAHSVKVGKGGPGAEGEFNTATNNGKASSFTLAATDALIAKGGGAGGSHWGSNGKLGLAGGSGGGGGANSGGGASAVVTPIPQSFAEFGVFTTHANAGGSAGSFSGGGGGGAGAVGQNGVSNGKSGNGGVGFPFDITGQEQYYAAGGGAGKNANNSADAGTGGSGIGGNGGQGTTPAERCGHDGVSGTGSGGGGSSATGTKGGTGGSGIVVVRFPWRPIEKAE